MTDRPLRLAVIGHTNTGKTSILRTLLRDTSLGEVADEAGTTRRNTAYALRVAGAVAVELSDTPGLEDAAAALAALRGIEQQRGLTPADALDALLADTPAALRPEVEPLRALQQADAGLLVFDAREAPKAKHWEEHELLRRCGRPLVAVLNCVSAPASREAEWDAAVRRNGLHAVVRFDAWVADEADAARLFTKLRELLGDAWRDPLTRLVAARRGDDARRTAAMLEAVATLAVDLGAHRVIADAAGRDPAVAHLAADLAAGWVRLRAALAELHGVDADRLKAVEAELDDALGAEQGPGLEQAAIAGTSAAVAAVLGGLIAGATKGGVIDLSTGGATMGLGVALGGAAGLALGGRELGRFALLKARRQTELGYSDATIVAVVARGLWLVRRLGLYGHASERPIEPPPTGDRSEALLRAMAPHIAAARRHRGWSRLTGFTTAGPRPDAAQRVIGKLARALADHRDPATVPSGHADP